jgi:hypothetical protein
MHVLNVFAEAQPSVYRTRTGARNFQVFTGVKLNSHRDATPEAALQEPM